MVDDRIHDWYYKLNQNLSSIYVSYGHKSFLEHKAQSMLGPMKRFVDVLDTLEFRAVLKQGLNIHLASDCIKARPDSCLK